ncbi:MAG: diphthamide synthesis protein [Candidatus Woesearchaeota archaeon]
MKVVFLHAGSDKNVVPVLEKSLSKLPKRVGLVTNIQYVEQLKKAKEFLEQKGKKVEIAGQVLGCDARPALKISDKIDAFLFIGSGEFHPIEVMVETDKKIVLANPETLEVKELSKTEAEKIAKRKKAMLSKFLLAKHIGIIVSIKPGQINLKQAVMLKKRLKKMNKIGYVFICDEIMEDHLTNFSFIESWINTACIRIPDEKNMLNIDDLKEVMDIDLVPFNQIYLGKHEKIEK